MRKVETTFYNFITLDGRIYIFIRLKSKSWRRYDFLINRLLKVENKGVKKICSKLKTLIWEH